MNKKRIYLVRFCGKTENRSVKLASVSSRPLKMFLSGMDINVTVAECRNPDFESA